MSNEEENDERIPEEGASQIHARNMEQLLQSTIAMQSYPDASEAQNVVAGMNSQVFNTELENIFGQVFGYLEFYLTLTI